MEEGGNVGEGGSVGEGGAGAAGAAYDDGGVGAVEAGDADPLDELLDPEEFERAVAGLCARDGCTGVEVVGGAGDLGADVLAVTPDGRRLVIQCKRYDAAATVGSQDVQRFGGTCFAVHGAEVAAVVTTAHFTAPAVEYAQWCGIVCVDRRALRAWRDGTGPAPWAAPVRPEDTAGC